MPRSPAWIQNSRAIQALAESVPSFAFDRAAVAELFQVSQRAAANLLDAMGAEKIGGAFIVPRERLLAYLDGRSDAAPGLKEHQRRHAVLRKLAEIRAAGPPLRAVRAALPRTAGSLPPGVTVVAPGEITIKFDPHALGTLLGIILELAELSERDPAAFAENLAPSPGEEDE